MDAPARSQDQSAARSRSAKPPHWRYVYFLLAAFDLMTVSAGLYLNHQIMLIYTRSVEVNRVWAARVAAYNRLGELATDVNTPGNDVFDSQAVDRESRLMRVAETRFDAHLRGQRREIEANLEPRVGAPLLALLDAIAHAKTDMVGEAERIFEHFRNGRPDLAGQRMATMDRKYAHLNAALLKLRNTVGEIQERNFNQQMAAAAQIQRYEYLIGMSIVLMVLGATFYGHKIARHMQLEAEERAQHYAALHEAEARTRSILQTAAEGIVTFDERGRIEAFNRAAERLFGYPAGEAGGQDIAALIPALAQRFPEGAESCAAEGVSPCTLGGVCPVAARSCTPAEGDEAAQCMLRGDVYGRRRDGSAFPVELSVSRQHAGSAATYTAIVRDMSDRHRAEEALRVAAVAQASNRAKSQFLANMSHEIRTPMNGVLGMSEMLLETELTPTQRRLAETVHRSGESLLEIIDRILDFSKIEAGRIELEAMDFNPRELVEEVVRLMAESAERKGLALRCRVDEDVPHALHGAPFRLRQVITNLLGNAVKFTHAGEVAIRVSRFDEQVPGSGCPDTVLRFEVSDTGIGIAESVQERLFQRFMQGDSSTTRRYGGTGLGLAISKELVERMGGRIGVRSAPGRGSEFWFTVRLAAPKATRHAPARDPAELAGRRALVVAGDASGCRGYEQTMRDADMQVQRCGDTAAALEALRGAAQRRHSFDLALVDCADPAAAVAFARAVQQDPATSGVVLVGIVAARSGGTHAHLCASGYVATVPRRLSGPQLYDRLVGALAAREVVAPVPARAGALAGVRVLLAEDNPINRDVARTMLASLGCDVCTVDNGRKALAMLQEAPFDIVLMDRQMPDMDGLEATAQIRALGLLRPRQKAGSAPERLPIIGVTASAMKGDRETCIAAGMDDYLAKPFRRDALRAMLLQWVLDRPAGRADRARSSA